MTYAPMSSGREERTVLNFTAAIEKVVHREPSDWNITVSGVLYCYRRGGLASEFSPF